MPNSSLAVCLGDSCIDAYLPPIGRSFIGGNAINVAVAMQAAGCPAAYGGTVGNDPPGRMILRALDERGVDVSQVTFHAQATRQVYTRLLPGGERQFVHELMAPRVPFRPDAALLDFARAGALAHCNWLSDPVDYLPALRGEDGPLISMDYGERYPADLLEATLRWVDLAFCSLPEERAGEAEEVAHGLRARGPRLVVVTLSGRGSLAFDGKQVYTQSAHPVDAVDTLGAGDAYIGTFLAGLLRGEPVPACMQHASQAAAQICTVYGAWPGAEIPAALS